MEANKDKSAKSTGCLLPVTRIRTIMKSSPDVSNIGQESVFLIAKAAELFIEELARRCRQNAENEKSLTYGDLAEVVAQDESLQFLLEIIPKKIKMSEYYAIQQRNRIESP